MVARMLLLIDSDKRFIHFLQLSRDRRAAVLQRQFLAELVHGRMAVLLYRLSLNLREHLVVEITLVDPTFLSRLK